jgi:hypothetical protein
MGANDGEGRTKCLPLAGLFHCFVFPSNWCVIPAKVGIWRLDICEAAGGWFFVRLKAYLVREVEVFFRHALSGL